MYWNNWKPLFVSVPQLTDLNQYKHGFCWAYFTGPLLISLQAVDDMNGKELNGRQVYVGRAQKKGERQNELKRKFEQMKQDRMTRYQVGWPILL